VPNDCSAEETEDRLYADRRNVYEVEKLSKDGSVSRNACLPIYRAALDTKPSALELDVNFLHVR
jgi:hypothetical protein